MTSAILDGSPVILLHGFAQTPASWNEVARRLQAQGHRTYVPDLYRWLSEQQGESAQGPMNAASLRALCRYVAETVHKVAEVEGPPMLVGYSMGGRIAAQTLVQCGFASPSHSEKEEKASCPWCPGQEAASHPDCSQQQEAANYPGAPEQEAAGHPWRPGQQQEASHSDPSGQEAADHPRCPEHSASRGAKGLADDALPLAALVLESAALGPADESARGELAKRNNAWAARLREEGVGPFIDWWETLPLFATQYELPETVRAALRAERVSHSAEILARSLETWGAHHQAAEPETIEALASAHAQGLPFLYIAGKHDKKYAAVAARLQEAWLPTALIPNVGHNTHLENPTAFVDVLTDVSL